MSTKGAGKVPPFRNHEYCAAIPPAPIRRTANCLSVKGHEGDHRNAEGDHWPIEKKAAQ